MPHFTKKVTTPGRRGFHYLYDEEEFIEAWRVYRTARHMGIGVNKIARDRARTSGAAAAIPPTAGGIIDALMAMVEPQDGEDLESYEVRYG